MSATQNPGRAYGGVPREERQRERRARLVAAGTSLFGTVGYAGTTIEMLCAEAGLNKRYFYESFRSTDELLAAVYTDATQRMQHQVAVAVLGAGEDLRDRAVAGITAFFQEADGNRAAARIMLSEMLPGSETAREAIRGAMHGWMDLIAGVFEGYDYRGQRIELVAASIWALMAGSAIRWALDDFQDPADELTALMEHVITDIIAVTTRS